jgi:regulator of sigma E protease
MFEKVLIFLVFLGPLIFFHELGHFFFARFFGVRVEVFSIGFGPKIFKYVKGGTEYAISIIPLGGYVKMFGDDPFSETPLTEEEKKVAFNHKSKWARFWIVFGGPLANIILAYVLYVGLLVGGEKVPQTKFGLIPENSAFHSRGLRSGDTIKMINDEKIMSFDDLNIKASKVETVTVERAGQTKIVDVNLSLQDFIDEFAKLLPVVRRPIVVTSTGEQFYLSLNKNIKEETLSLEEMDQLFKGEVYLYKFKNEDGKITFDETSETLLKVDSSKKLLAGITEAGFFPVDLMVQSIVMSSPADKIGMKKDDILVSVNKIPVKAFDELRAEVQKSDGKAPIEISYLREGKLISSELVPEVKEIKGQGEIKTIGVYSSVEYIPPKLVESKADSVGDALLMGFTRTWDGIEKTVGGYKKLITREVALSNVGGPFAIGKVASDSFNISLSMFFRLMAFISINLGVINLFPIPVLDGGHIMFLGLEAINRGPLSRRKLEFAQRIGLSLLFFLIFIALFNDITKLVL